MASQRGAVRGLVTLAMLALVGAGCGGGSDSTPQTGATRAARPASSHTHSEKPGGREAEARGPRRDEGHGAKEGEDGEAPKDPGPSIVPMPEPKPTSAQKAHADQADIVLESPALGGGTHGVAPLPTRHTCQGVDESPPLRWRGVPSGTAELALFVMNAKPGTGGLFFDWAVAGIDPRFGELEAGKVPPGAVIGRNSSGKRAYSICPDGSETVFFALYAVPKRLGARPGFDPASLRQEVTNASDNVGLLAVSVGGG